MMMEEIWHWYLYAKLHNHKPKVINIGKERLITLDHIYVYTIIMHKLAIKTQHSTCNSECEKNQIQMTAGFPQSS
jgi:hypothetical protein